MGRCLSVILPPRVLGISRRASRNGSTDPITDNEDYKEESSMIQQVDSLRNASLDEGTDQPEIKVHKIEDLTMKHSTHLVILAPREVTCTFIPLSRRQASHMMCVTHPPSPTQSSHQLLSPRPPLTRPCPSLGLCVGDLPWMFTVVPDVTTSSGNNVVTVRDVLHIP